MRDWTKSSTQLLHARDSIELNGVQLLVVDLIFQKFFPWLHSSWAQEECSQGKNFWKIKSTTKSCTPLSSIESRACNSCVEDFVQSRTLLLASS